MNSIDIVIDAHALMVFLQGEPGHEMVSRLFHSAANSNRPLLITSVNYGEILYIILRELGKKKQLEMESIIEELPITIVDVDKQIAKAAATFKAKGGMSYADCFAAGLAFLRKASVLTGDKEFKTVETEIKIIWI